MISNISPDSLATKSRLTTVDFKENYGRHLLSKFILKSNINRCLDLGCGEGDDINIVLEEYPEAKCVGIDYDDWNKEKLKHIETISLNIENSSLPFENEEFDLVIANQILEHTKEVFWINHEIFRTLKVGGHLFVGVPNLLAMHNRILGLFGGHPTCSKMISAHVRSISKNDVKLFYEVIAKDFARITKFGGSQFYPFPKKIARPLANAFPSLATSIFFMVQKVNEYNGEFIGWLERNPLATNYYRGAGKH